LLGVSATGQGATMGAAFGSGASPNHVWQSGLRFFSIESYDWLWSYFWYQHCADYLASRAVKQSQQMNLSAPLPPDAVHLFPQTVSRVVWRITRPHALRSTGKEKEILKSRSGEIGRHAILRGGGEAVWFESHLRTI